MRKLLILTLVALIGFTSCTKEEPSRYQVQAVPHVSYQPDENGAYTVTFDASASTGTIVYCDWYFLKDGKWLGFNRTTERVFSTRLFNSPGSVIWGLQVVGPFGQLSGIVAFESARKQPIAAAPIVINEQDQEQEQTETVETTAFSLKNSSEIFGLFVEFINGRNQPEKIHINAGAIVIIKAVPGSIQAPIDVIVTQLNSN
ncbi:MAG: hypothetical protein ACTHLE_07270 [Agriterribacter sp.]